jgi:hypothetical protein
MSWSATDKVTAGPPLQKYCANAEITLRFD